MHSGDPELLPVPNWRDRSTVRVVLREVQTQDSRNDIGTELPHCVGDVKNARVVVV
jgi:hypothetical protein